MPEMTITADVSIYCSCGEGLCSSTKIDGTVVTVDPCEKCLKESRKDGYDDGHSDGYDKGYEEGLDEGEKKA